VRRLPWLGSRATRNRTTACFAWVLGLVMAGLLASATAAPAQTLNRELPAPRPGGCPPQVGEPPRETDTAARQQAARLVAEARNASVLGDDDAALGLLGRAAELDPAAENIAFLLARTLEQVGDAEGALREYCRYLQLTPGARDAAEVRERVAQIAPPVYSGGVSEAAVTRFGQALSLYDENRLQEAEEAFTAVLDETPDWPAAHFNRALVRLELQRPNPALTDLERYLELAPLGPDRTAALDLVNRLRDLPPVAHPGTAFAAGLLPGGGHFYTGRPAAGMLVLAAAGGAVAFGLSYEVVHVECRSIPVNNVCPPEDVGREWTERPYMGPAAAVAMAATLIGAWDAYRGVRRQNEAAAAVRLGSGTVTGPSLSILPPMLTVSGDRAGVHWIRVRF
jgi:tetratricopeptide (TPR) repeat protein